MNINSGSGVSFLGMGLFLVLLGAVSAASSEKAFGYVEHLKGGFDGNDKCLYRINRNGTVLCPPEFQSYVYLGDVVIPARGAVLRFVPLSPDGQEFEFSDPVRISKKKPGSRKESLSVTDAINVPASLTTTRNPEHAKEPSKDPGNSGTGSAEKDTVLMDRSVPRLPGP
ncbi:hypothetical protein [Succinimonas amylolytica]|uniref:hypothetical protein n=1 Tax=Succinimonas amylolytica TaxID=83769 RepID=UPI0023A8CE13